MQSSTPKLLFQAVVPALRTNDVNFDETPDDKRFLLVVPAQRAGSQPLMVVTDWVKATKGK